MGNRPMLLAAHKAGRLTGTPRGLVGLAIDTVLPVCSQVGRRSHKSSYLRRFIREAASGARLSDPLVQSELESWRVGASAAARAGIGPLSLASGAFLCLLTAPASRVSSYVILPARVLATWAWGMTTALGHLLVKGLGSLASLQPAGRARLVWLHKYGVRLHQSG